MAADYDLNTFISQCGGLSPDDRMSVMEEALLCSEVGVHEKYRLYIPLMSLYAREVGAHGRGTDHIIVEEAIESLLGECDGSVDFVVISRMLEDQMGSFPQRGRTWLLRAVLTSNRLFRKQKSELVNIYTDYCHQASSSSPDTAEQLQPVQWPLALSKILVSVYISCPDTVRHILASLQLPPPSLYLLVSVLFPISPEGLKVMLSRQLPDTVGQLLPKLEYEDVRLLLVSLYFDPGYEKNRQAHVFSLGCFFEDYKLDRKEVSQLVRKSVNDLFTDWQLLEDAAIESLATDEVVDSSICRMVLSLSSEDPDRCLSIVDSFNIPRSDRLDAIVFAIDKWTEGGSTSSKRNRQTDENIKRVIQRVCQTDEELEYQLSLKLRLQSHDLTGYFFGMASLASRYSLARHDCHAFQRTALLFLFSTAATLPRDVSCVVLQYLLTLERPKVVDNDNVLYTISKRSKQISDLENHHEPHRDTLFSYGSWD
eukprot:TRINITY_DN16187_c2_g1_i2.p1 TRINITY_DN16187_c2_g1~~TRINITY_DN16187_c2_g1_i2.p1  ORF type:complete len:506 (+),score=41.17 TRINITY_DN16187_c2_g1_i2:73-1518(+)